MRWRCSASPRRRSSTPCCSCPLALVWLWRERGRRVALQALAVFAIAAAVLVVPWFALSPGGVWDSVHAQVGRGLHTESLGASILLAADRLGEYHAHVVSTAPAISRDLAGGLPRCDRALRAPRSRSLAALAPAVVLLWRRVHPGLAFATSVAGFLAFTKVLSPQYVVWLIPLAPFGGDRGDADPARAALALAQSWYFHYHDLWAVGPQAWTLLSRNLVLVALYALLLWKTSTPSSREDEPPVGALAQPDERSGRRAAAPLGRRSSSASRRRLPRSRRRASAG